MAEKDITQIGTSNEGKEIIEFLMVEKRWFSHQFTALKFAISVALKENLVPDPEVKYITSHHVASFDKDGLLQGLIFEFFPNDPPYKKAQSLADVGLKFINKKINDEEWDLLKFIN